ncbi:hypothetical protein [Marinifilum flexuosum]|uniref:hypothetical protein n=1 Tax=Marinifilum flexuosum TaxID=1117708 RepID=UPI0024958978|nr:hypothetical protein [Marinifilum flexuosum]
MTEQEIKDKILEIFKSQRKNPTVDFDESHFMDYLTYPAHPKNTIKNSFKGVRKYYRFMDELELEFSICFSLQDLDKYYTVDKLSKKVLDRIKKGKGNNMILKRRLEQKEKYYFEIALILILAALYYWHGINWISILITIGFGIIIYWILSNKLHSKRHNKRLAERMKPQ